MFAICRYKSQESPIGTKLFQEIRRVVDYSRFLSLPKKKHYHLLWTWALLHEEWKRAKGFPRQCRHL